VLLSAFVVSLCGPLGSHVGVVVGLCLLRGLEGWRGLGGGVGGS
jgi:hypothetical protein